MFRPADPEIARKTRTLLVVCQRLERGDVISHETIEAVTGEVRNTPPYQYIVWGKLDDALQKSRGIALLNERTVGYKLCTLTEHLITHSRLRRRRAVRQMRKSQRALERLPIGELTDHQRLVRAHQLRLLGEATGRIQIDDNTDWNSLNGGGMPRHPHAGH